MTSSRPYNWFLIALFFAFSLVAQAQTLRMISGNGQLVATQALTNNPLVVQAVDASGHAVPNVTISWATSGGTVNPPTSTTDANGQATANFLSTTLQLGTLFAPATVTASSAYGTVNFVVTTVISSALQPLVAIQVLSPTLDNPTLTAPSGSTIPRGVQVQIGVDGGGGIPSVGVLLVDALNPSDPIPASCAGPNGEVLTDNTGTATCDVVVNGAPGTYSLRAYVGGIQYTRAFTLTISPGAPCRYSLSASNQSFTASGGAGNVNVATNSTCGWSASSNSSFITITNGSSGTGNGTVTYTVAANTGAVRVGTLTIAGQTYTVTQAAAGGGSPVAVATSSLPNGTVNIGYSAPLAAAGGTPPYTWSITGTLPPGLTLNGATIQGTPSAAGSYSFTATVTDKTGARASQNLSITINSSTPPPTGSGFSITNASFPNGVVGQAYPPQVLQAVGGCITPFSPQPNFSVTQGSLPNGLTIQTNSDGSHSLTGTPTTPGQSQFTLQASDTCQHTATATFTITITGTPTSVQMLVSPPSLAFTVQAQVASAPADQTITFSLNNGSTAEFSAAVSTATGGPWVIAKTATMGNTPGTFTVGITNFSTLPAGTYNGSISITSSAANSPLTVPVSLTVLPTMQLTVSPGSFTINAISGSSTPLQQAINVSSGGTPAQFAASASATGGGSWLSVSPSQGTTNTIVTATINPSGLAVGQYNGSITITPSSGTAQTVSVKLIVAAPAVLSAMPAPLSFTYQQDSSAPPSQTVAINSNGAAVSVSVSAATQTGGPWLAATPASGTTNVSLSVSVSAGGIAPGSYTGTITITPADPSVASLTIPVTLSVIAAAPLINAATNAASYVPGAIAPGEIVTIFGANMGPSTLATLQLTDQGTVATSLGGTQVFFDGYPAPLIYSSATSISVIVPYEIGTGTTSMTIEYQGIRSNSTTLTVLPALPGIFTMDSSGHGQGAIINQDGTVNSSQNGAAPGSYVSIYSTGAGQTSPPNADGTIAPAAASTQLPVTVQIGGETANMTYAGAAPGEPAGVIQVNAQIPADAPRGTSVSVIISVNGVSSQRGVTVAIAP